jgi:hypothetical protein
MAKNDELDAHEGDITFYTLEDMWIQPNENTLSVGWGKCAFQLDLDSAEMLHHYLTKRHGFLEPYGDNNGVMISVPSQHKKLTIVVTGGPIFTQTTLYLTENSRKGWCNALYRWIQRQKNPPQPKRPKFTKGINDWWRGFGDGFGDPNNQPPGWDA